MGWQFNGTTLLSAKAYYYLRCLQEVLSKESSIAKPVAYNASGQVLRDGRRAPLCIQFMVDRSIRS